MRVRGAEEALGEDQVDDEEEEDTGGDEDLGSDGDADVVLAVRPDNAHDHGRDTSHAEAEHHPAHEEFVATPSVHLEDRHVTGGGAREEEEEDCSDGDVEGDGGDPAQSCGGWWVGTTAELLLELGVGGRGHDEMRLGG